MQATFSPIGKFSPKIKSEIFSALTARPLLTCVKTHGMGNIPKKQQSLKDRRAKRKILWAKRDELQKQIAASTDATVKADLESELAFLGKWIQIFDAKIKEDTSE